MDTFQHPLPLQGHLSSGEAHWFKGKRREVPGILTQNSSVCSIRIQVHDTVVSNRANSGFQQMLVFIVHLLIQHYSVLPSIPSSFSHTCPISHSIQHTHMHTHTQIPHPLTRKLSILIQCAFSINPQVNKSQRTPVVTFLSSSVWMQFLSGFRSTTLALIHSTPDGITFAVGRPDEDNGLAPAPTRVQMGW